MLENGTFESTRVLAKMRHDRDGTTKYTFVMGREDWGGGERCRRASAKGRMRLDGSNETIRESHVSRVSCGRHAQFLKRLRKKKPFPKSQKSMPRSSTLGDHRAAAERAAPGGRPPVSQSVSVTIPDDEQPSRKQWITQCLTMGTCILLVGSGVGVGIWAAM